MIQELLFTSYEGRGLRQGGGGGFCTVLSTEGMAVNMASALEKLSGYRHPFDVHDTRSVGNPVIFRHAILTIGGTTYHVLSRVADMRQEHTGRSNKLAHHIALTDDDLPIGGPARVLRHPGFCRETWDRKVALVPAVPRSSLPRGDSTPGPCTAWEAVAGDAGWAGVVADGLAKGDAVYHVIFPLGADTLALVDEALRLLPPSRRWDVTFSTYYTSAVPGSACNLRFLLDGTPEAEKVRRDHRAAKIDLLAALGTPHATPLVTAARTGAVPRPEATASRPASPRTRPSAARAEADFWDGSPLGTPEGDLRLAPAAPRRGLHAADRSPLDLPPPRPFGEQPRTLGGAIVALAAAVIVLLIATMSLAGVMIANSLRAEPEVVRNDPAPEQTDKGTSSEQPSPAMAPNSPAEDSTERTGEVQNGGASTQRVGDPLADPNAQASAANDNKAHLHQIDGRSTSDAQQSDPAESEPDSRVRSIGGPSASGVSKSRANDKPILLELVNELPRVNEKPSSSNKTLYEPIVLAEGVSGDFQAVRLLGADSIQYLSTDSDPTEAKLATNDRRIQLKFDDDGKSKFLDIAELELSEGTLTANWLEKDAERVFAKKDWRPIANSLRCCILEVKTDAALYMLPLMRPQPLSLETTAEKVASSKTSDPTLILPDKNDLQVRRGKIEAPAEWKKKGLQVLPSQSDDGTSGEVVIQAEAIAGDSPTILMKFKYDLLQDPKTNAIYYQIKPEIERQYASADAMSFPGKPLRDWETGDDPISEVKRFWEPRKEYWTQEAKNAPPQAPPGAPAGFRTKDVVESDIKRVQVILDMAATQQTLIDELKAKPLIVPVAVGAKYGEGLPVVWIYGSRELTN